MPIVTFGGVRIECDLGANLRRVLLKAKLPLYHPLARIANCRGLGTCGTCAVKLRGSASWPTKLEALRLRMPPHAAEAGLRLACQCVVHGDLDVEKFGGVWGQNLSQTVWVSDSKAEPQPRLQPPTAPRDIQPAMRPSNQPAIEAAPFRSSGSVIRALSVASGRLPIAPRRHRAAMSEQATVPLAKLRQMARERQLAIHS
ncbi:hypothetical protein Poly24_40190 [Rosistilla carotiformis]|uniref:2Fe-2S ferredoxin-type domain-containing protein n=1 Tax=Rosistilla carotiformis TaxID=2528017 RepID=A0A518JXN4_9BACT|nr:2Fe-2S iron-sulfur cluster-binding protein [Rosistilla carotiformis]QDV70299.1 hypothetical protein Poly24_40190 [Rosistilla carotiformis]